MGLLSKGLDRLRVCSLADQGTFLPSIQESRLMSLKARSHHGQKHKSAQPHLPMSVA